MADDAIFNGWISLPTEVQEGLMAGNERKGEHLLEVYQEIPGDETSWIWIIWEEDGNRKLWEIDHKSGFGCEADAWKDGQRAFAKYPPK